MANEYNVTLNQIAYGLLEEVRAKLGDDTDLSLDQVKDQIHDVRATLLKQKFDKNLRVIDDAFTQPLGALEIESVDSSIHSNITSGRYVFRTVKKIPPTIERRNYEGTITRVGPADQLATSYNLVSYERALYSGNGRFNKDMIFAFLKDDKIHVISNSGAYHKAVQFIETRGVFQNPEQVARFTDTSGSSLAFSDEAYPITRNMRSTIEGMILKERLGIKAQAPSDKVNDGEENVN